MIEVSNVSKSYGNVAALQGVSFSIKRGEVVGLLGPNGAGKTTLLKILTGYFEPTEGTVRIGGLEVSENPVQVRQKIGYLPENAPLYPEMLVQESLMLAAELRGIAPEKRPALLEKAIKATGLTEVLTRPIGTLSKGYHQRVGLAQAILHEPDILILDEPTNGLDPDQIVEVRGLIRRLASHSTVILSTHILFEVEQTCERVLVLIDGRLRADARLGELTSTNRFRLVLAEGQAEPIATELRALSGVKNVKPDKADGQQVFWVDGEEGVDLGRTLFEKARSAGWPVRELHRATRTLESVFRELSAGREVQL